MLSYKNINGFTLIELSIVLVIIGLLVGLGAGMIGPLTTFVKVRETRDLQDASLQSIISWAASSNTLPNNTNFPTIAKSRVDAWGQDLIYLYDATLYSATPTKDTICGRRSTSLKLFSSYSSSNVAFAILSRADNPAFKSKLDGVTITTSGTATGTINSSGLNGDIIRWVTLDELRSKIGCQGAPLKIVNNELPYGALPNNYSVKLMADGGVPFTTPASYKWCVNTLPTGLVQTGGKMDANCLTLPESSWAAASTELTISFPAAAAGLTTGAHPITVVVRDNADGVTTSNACNSADPGDNCAQKLFVLTVNPQ